MTPISEPIETVLARMEAASKAVTTEEYDKRHNERKAIQNRESIAELRLGWNAPKRHAKAKVVSDGQWDLCRKGLVHRLGEGFMVVLYGSNGTGKTQLAVEVMRHQIEQRIKSARFTTAIEFFMAVKTTYRADAQRGEEQVVAEFCKPSLLVVDETEKRSESAWENNLLFHVANSRYNDEKDTLFISNLERVELEQHLGRSLVSRLNETGGMIHCDWPSRR